MLYNRLQLQQAVKYDHHIKCMWEAIQTTAADFCSKYVDYGKKNNKLTMMCLYME